MDLKKSLLRNLLSEKKVFPLSNFDPPLRRKNMSMDPKKEVEPEKPLYAPSGYISLELNVN